MHNIALHNPSPLQIATELLGEWKDVAFITNHNDTEYYHPRLCRWVAFFNDRFAKCLSIYSFTVVAIYRDFVRGGISLNQTEFEFQLSLHFYETVFKENPHLHANRYDEVEELLHLALIYGKYPGMVIGSLTKASRLLQNNLTPLGNEMFFQYLFIKYKNEAPATFTRNIVYLQPQDIDFMMFWIQGNSLRKYEHLPLPLSKSESFVLQSLVAKKFFFKSDAFCKSIIAAKLLLVKNDVQLLKEFLGANRYFTQEFTRFMTEFDFWRQVYAFICKIDLQTCHFGLRDFHDYFIYQRYTVNGAYSLRNRTQASVEASIQTWHNYLGKNSLKFLVNLKWGNPQTNFVYHAGAEYHFELITSADALMRESQAMCHCVYSYLDSCYGGKTSIWSVKKINAAGLEHHLTIQVNNKEVVQVARKRNVYPSEKDKQMVAQWAEQRGYYYGL